NLVERPHVVAAGAGVREAELLHELALAREHEDVAVVGTVAADPDVAFAVGRDAVVAARPVVALTRSAPGLHEVAFRIELENRRRGNAALRRRWILGRIHFLGLERRTAVNDVD